MKEKRETKRKMTFSCDVHGCDYEGKDSSALSNHRRRAHLDLFVTCRDADCSQMFFFADRERAHFYKEHNELACGFDGCAKKDHKYSEWKKLKKHLEQHHNYPAGDDVARNALIAVRDQQNMPVPQRQENQHVQREQLHIQQSVVQEDDRVQNAEQQDIAAPNQVQEDSTPEDFRSFMTDFGPHLGSNLHYDNLVAFAAKILKHANNPAVAGLVAGSKRKASSDSGQDVSRRRVDNAEAFCHLCNRQFPRKANYQRHYLDEHTMTKRQCEHCEQSFDTSSKLETHVKKEHQNVRRQPKLLCTVDDCDKKFWNREQLRLHLHSAHQIGSAQKLTCPYCSGPFPKEYNTLSALNKHVGKTHSDKPKLRSDSFASTN